MTQDIWKQFSEELLGFIKSKISHDENAEDILQEVFIKIHKHHKNIQTVEKMPSWVYQITRNSIIDYYRKKRLVYSDSAEIKDALPEEAIDSNSEFIQCLKPFVSKLPDKYRDVLIKTAYEKMSQKDYAIENGISYSATKSRLQRARVKLYDMFMQCCAIQSDIYGNIITSNTKNCNC